MYQCHSHTNVYAYKISKRKKKQENCHGAEEQQDSISKYIVTFFCRLTFFSDRQNHSVDGITMFLMITLSHGVPLAWHRCWNTHDGLQTSACKVQAIAVHGLLKRPAHLNWAASQVLPSEVHYTLRGQQLSPSGQPLTSRETVEFRRAQVSFLSSLTKVDQQNWKWTRSSEMGCSEHCRRKQGWSASLLWILQSVLHLKHFNFLLSNLSLPDATWSLFLLSCHLLPETRG